MGLAAALRDSLRVACGVTLLSFLGYFLYARRPPIWFAADVSTSLLWGAITVILVASPVIGKTARTGLERCIGTLLGGLLAYLVALANSAVLYSVAAGAVALAAMAAGSSMQLEYSGKLFAITYLIVSGATQGGKDALVSAFSRMLGILGGVLLTFVLSCLVFPKSATDKCLDDLHAALKLLEQLNSKAWSGLEHSRKTVEGQALLQVISVAVHEKEASQGTSEDSEEHDEFVQADRPALGARSVQPKLRKSSSKITAWLGTSQSQDSDGPSPKHRITVSSRAGSALNSQELAPILSRAGSAGGGAEQASGQVLDQPSGPITGRLSGRLSGEFIRANNRPRHSTSSTTAASEQGTEAALGRLTATSILPRASSTASVAVSDSVATTINLQQGGSVKDVWPEEERLKLQALIDQECEDAIYGVHKTCSSFTENLKHAFSELYVGQFLARRWYLPLLFQRSKATFHLPVAELEELRSAARRVARVLWTLHLTIQEGFDGEMMVVLQQRYPAHLLDKLRDSCAGVLRDAATAFPGSALTAGPMPAAHLHSFGTVVAKLLSISEQQRHQIVEHVHNYSTVRVERLSSGCDHFVFDELPVDERSAQQQAGQQRQQAGKQQASMQQAGMQQHQQEGRQHPQELGQEHLHHAAAHAVPMLASNEEHHGSEASFAMMPAQERSLGASPETVATSSSPSSSPGSTHRLHASSEPSPSSQAAAPKASTLQHAASLIRSQAFGSEIQLDALHTTGRHAAKTPGSSRMQQRSTTRPDSSSTSSPGADKAVEPEAGSSVTTDASAAAKAAAETPSSTTSSMQAAATAAAQTGTDGATCDGSSPVAPAASITLASPFLQASSTQSWGTAGPWQESLQQAPQQQQQQQQQRLATHASLKTVPAGQARIAATRAATSPGETPAQSPLKPQGSIQRQGSRQVPLLHSLLVAGPSSRRVRMQPGQLQLQPSSPSASLPELRTRSLVDSVVMGNASPASRRITSTSTEMFQPASPRQSEADSELAALQRVDTPRLFFPDTASGYLAKVRWYSFQFLMEQLEQELGQLRQAVDGAAAKLPGLPRAKPQQQAGEKQQGQQGEEEDGTGQGDGAIIAADAQQACKGAVQLNIGALEAMMSATSSARV